MWSGVAGRAGPWLGTPSGVTANMARARVINRMLRWMRRVIEAPGLCRSGAHTSHALALALSLSRSAHCEYGEWRGGFHLRGGLGADRSRRHGRGALRGGGAGRRDQHRRRRRRRRRCCGAQGALAWSPAPALVGQYRRHICGGKPSVARSQNAFYGVDPLRAASGGVCKVLVCEPCWIPTGERWLPHVLEWEGQVGVRGW